MEAINKILGLLILSNPLSYDYSYNQIPYQQISNPLVILSILFYLGIFIYALLGFKKKDRLSFSILMFLITLSIGSNLFIEIGMLMGERLVFIPSIFFLLAVVFIGEKIVTLLSEKTHTKKIILASILIFPAFVASAYQTITRNADWKNNQTLPLADISKSPESAGWGRNPPRGFDKAMNIGVGSGKNSHHPKLKKIYNKAATYAFRKDSMMLVIYYNLGGIYYNTSNFPGAGHSQSSCIDPISNARRGFRPAS
ncbi:MAG: hypothetical protein IPI10_09315 [Bacteroidetes bacterium]|nr:hypothetical protein [Bacteroidota bacterium]